MVSQKRRFPSRVLTLRYCIWLKIYWTEAKFQTTPIRSWHLLIDILLISPRRFIFVYRFNASSLNDARWWNVYIPLWVEFIIDLLPRYSRRIYCFECLLDLLRFQLYYLHLILFQHTHDLYQTLRHFQTLKLITKVSSKLWLWHSQTGNNDLNTSFKKIVANYCKEGMQCLWQKFF